MTVSAFSSLSLDPALILVCIGNEATTAPVMANAKTFAVNVLRDDQEAVSRRFASPGGHRFDGIGYSDEGTPSWTASARLQCRVVARHPRATMKSTWARSSRPACTKVAPALLRGG